MENFSTARLFICVSDTGMIFKKSELTLTKWLDSFQNLSQHFKKEILKMELAISTALSCSFT